MKKRVLYIKKNMSECMSDVLPVFCVCFVRRERKEHTKKISHTYAMMNDLIIFNSFVGHFSSV